MQRKTLLGTLFVLSMIFVGSQLIVHAAGGAASIPPVSFAAPVDYTTGTLPFANAVADFNGDKILDIAVVNYNSGNVSVLLGNGDGTFQAQTLYTVGSYPSAITTGDFNGDGAPDIAVADEIGNTISILINKADGTGTFNPAVPYPAGQAPRGIATGSLRNNGILDLVVANNNGGNITVFLGNGNGTFQTGVNYTAHTNPKSVALGDFNNDGILDIACANHNTNDVSILLGNGDGTFKAPVNYAVGKDPRHVLAYDFNKDGRLDLVTANGGESTISILYGNGDGTFQPQIKYTANASPRWLAVADYNNDGWLDVATSNYNDKNVSVLLGTGLTAAGQAFTTHQDYTVGPNPTGLAAGAFNNSGLPDIAVTVGGLPSAPNTYMAILINIPVSVSPTTLNFNPQVLNTTSAPLPVTLTNSAPNALSITGVSISGTNASDFNIQSNTCGSTLSANSSCTINVTFTPSGVNGRAATLSIVDGAGTQTVTLKGNGTAVQLAPTSLTFASQTVGTTSPPQTITLTDVSGNALTISSITITGDFAQTNTCGTGVAGKKSCTISVTFTPTGNGTRTGAVSITDNGGGSPQTVPLTGTGAGATVTLTVSPASLNFPVQVVGTSSAAQAVTVTNTSSSTVVNISGFSFTGSAPKDYSQTNNCGTSLAPNAGCTVNVTFKPTTANTRTATLNITDDATNSPQTVALTGVGTAVSFSPTSLTFAAQTVGTTSPAQVVTLTNVSAVGTLTVTQVSITGTNLGDFAQTNNCSSVAPKGTCTISVTFKPTATGARSASVSVVDNGGGSPQTVPLSGTGQ